MKENNNKYIAQLDGLRFFAVLMVMMGHWLQWQWTNPFMKAFPFVHGVTLFFVLSGFLITRILLTNRDEALITNGSRKSLLKNFYIRRFLRIFPIYYLLIVFLFCIDFQDTRVLSRWLFSYSINIYQSIHNVYVGDFSHFWSLAVEEQFYLFWPFLILFISTKNIFKSIIITIVLSLLFKSCFHFFVGKWMATSYFTLNCMSSLGLGALLSYVTLYNKKVSAVISKPWVLYGVLGVYLVLFIAQYYLKIYWYGMVGEEFMFAILSVFIVLRASTNGFKWGIKMILENTFVLYSGKISYGLYVYHGFIPFLYYFIAPRIGLSIDSKYTTFVAFYLLTFIVASISWTLIEKPISRLKSRVPYLK
ncbi:MAG: acyltransferase [Bacteroidota bacterium]